jgi:hypothetical protein
VAIEREEGEERKEEEERARPNRYAPKCASLGGALLWSKGISEGGALLSTMACAMGRPATSTTKDVRHLSAIQLSLDMEYVFLGVYL